MWIIEKTIFKGDYNYALVPEHPKSTKNGYVLEHRIIVENKIGRLLTSKEIVHHVNGLKKDNRPENLEVLSSNSEHGKLHQKDAKTKYAKLKCPYCKQNFERRAGNTFLYKGSQATFCSRHCNGKFKTLTFAEQNKGISGNLVNIFYK